MKRRVFVTAVAVLISMTALVGLLYMLGRTRPVVPSPVLAAQLASTPMVIEVDPSLAPNDLDIPIVITGTGFTAGLSGTLVITPPAVYLGDTALGEVTWVSSTTLHAVVPWGLDPAVYRLEVENPDGGSGSLTDAFTVSQGIGVWNAGELYGGTISQIAVHPDDPQTIYAAVGEVGLFRSADGAQSWKHKSADGGYHFAIDPFSPNRVYIVGPQQGEIRRSDDGGDNWTSISLTFPVSQTEGRDCWAGVQVFAHPTISGTVYASACGAYGDESGLVKLTNYGEDWSPIITGLTDTQVTDLAFYPPTDPTTMYLGTANGNIFESTDKGDSWTYVSQPVGNIAVLSLNPHGDHEVWVSIDGRMGDPCVLRKSEGSDLTTWTSLEVEGEPACPWAIDFAPRGWGSVYSQTVFISAGPGGGGYKTTDGGESWTRLTPESVRDIALHPTESDIIYAGSWWNGVQKTIDDGENWESVKQGLTGVVPHQLDVPSDQPDVVYAIAWDAPVIYRATQGGEAWQSFPVPGQANGLQVDPFTSTRIYLGSGNNVYISTDGGETWPLRGDIVPPDQCEGCLITALRASSTQPGLLLAGVTHYSDTYETAPASIYRSTNYGEDWARASVPQAILVVADLAFHPVTPNIVYASTGTTDYGSGMYKSIDGGATWQRIGEGTEAISSVASIGIEPVAPHRVFVYSGGSEGGIWLSEDGGEEWTRANTPPSADIQQIHFVPSDPPALYAASMGDVGGLYRSTDGAQTWSKAPGLLGEVQVYSLDSVTATDRVILYAGTTGGRVESGGAQALRVANNSGTQVNAGVYRYTMQNSQKVYLPLVLRAYTP